MDWNMAIERYREALKRVLASLVAMAALTDGEGFLTRYSHRAVLRLLRPAEAAARRLVIIVARDLAVPALQERRAMHVRRPAKAKPCSTILRTGIGTGIFLPHGVPMPAALAHLVPARPAPRPLAFRLTDPPRRPARPRAVPAWAAPRISRTDQIALRPMPEPPSPRDPIDVTRLRLRLAALAAALDDLPRQAQRFVRWAARQRRAIANGSARRLGPLRFGRPPGGWRPGASRRRAHEVDDILANTHSLALRALEGKDTS
jgi:hypothetical protein